jgi:1-acyl-sn-glycerol-3-phosphate acyltransferase
MRSADCNDHADRASADWACTPAGTAIRAVFSAECGESVAAGYQALGRLPAPLRGACGEDIMRFFADPHARSALAGKRLAADPPTCPPGAFVDTWLTMTSTLLAIIARVLSGASVRWIDCQPDVCQRVYFANHTSHLDAIVLWSSLPSSLRGLTRPVAAKDYWEKGVVRRYMARTFNALLIDRANIKVHQSPVDLMLREIGDRQSLIVFPEGGRNTESEISEFKSGLYYLAKKRPDLELVPVHIDNLNRVLPRGEFLPVPLLSLVTFGPPIWLEAGEPKVRFLTRAREAVRRLKDL